MSFNPLNHVIINKKIGDVNEYNRKGLSEDGLNTKNFSRRIGSHDTGSISMENKRDSKRQTKNYGTYVGNSRKKCAYSELQKLSVDNARNKQNVRILYLFVTNVTYLRKNETFVYYNPIMLKGMKGFRMSTNNIDLRKTTTVDEIIDLEKKLLGVMGILDAFSLSSEIGAENSTEALALVRDSILDTIINQDIKMLKEKVSYMFGVCSDVYHGGGVMSLD